MLTVFWNLYSQLVVCSMGHFLLEKLAIFFLLFQLNNISNNYDLCFRSESLFFIFLFICFLVIEEKFQYNPRNKFFYEIKPYDIAIANCKAPRAQPPLTPTWINGTEEIDVNDPRVTTSMVSNDGIWLSLRIQNATKYDTGTWACKATNKYGSRLSFFNLSLYGKSYTIHYLNCHLGFWF